MPHKPYSQSQDYPGKFPLPKLFSYYLHACINTLHLIVCEISIQELSYYYFLIYLDIAVVDCRVFVYVIGF